MDPVSGGFGRGGGLPDFRGPALPEAPGEALPSGGLPPVEVEEVAPGLPFFEAPSAPQEEVRERVVINDLASLLAGEEEDEVFELAVAGEEVGAGPLAGNYSGFAFDDDDEEDEEDASLGLDVDSILAAAIDLGASDVNINADDEVAFIIFGEVRRMPEFGVPSDVVMGRVQKDLVSHVMNSVFITELELDVSYTLRSGPHRGRRTRMNVARVNGAPSLTFRLINDVIPPPEALGVSPELLSWIMLPRGLVMVNGPTGSGKTTTIASLINRVTEVRPHKIVTMEKPIEFIYSNENKALVVQREIGRDSHSFAGALKSAMRQQPNIIVVGEVRDREEVDALLQAVETGHLCVSTMHTESAPATLNRMLSLYTGDDLRRVRASLSVVARGFVNQVLVKTADGRGMMAVREVLAVDRQVQEFILRGDSLAMREYQEEKGITMEHELVRVVREGLVTPEEASFAASHPLLFWDLLKEQG